MESNIGISIDTDSLRDHMNIIIPGMLSRLTPDSSIQALIKRMVHQDLELTFKTQGNNIGRTWKPLKDVTRLSRIKAGLPEGPPLLRSGNIRSSIGTSEHGWSTISTKHTTRMKLRRGAHAGSSHPFNKSNANLLMVHTIGDEPKLPARPLFDINGYGVSGKVAKEIRSLVRQRVWQVCQGSI